MMIQKRTPRNPFKFLLFYPFILLLLASCATTNRNLVYFSDLDKDYTNNITNAVAAKIQNGDLLNITITTLSPEYNQLFSSGAVPTIATTNPATNQTAVRDDISRNGYLVNENGQVNLPVLGMVKLAGLTKEEAAKKITDEVAKSAKNPIVNIRFLNYRVTVIGEVTKPGSFTVPDEHVNVLEALGLAGDMTAYGLRDKVLVIREKEGVRTIKALNLNDKNVFESPYFQLQQNDVVYVQPDNKEKNDNNKAAVNYPKIAITTAIISAIAVLVTTISSRIK
ncbi:MAG: polysaccharide biosynthesis/export family protein [Niabella sp.]|nr:polysaccharide biosynthesis/export family protein [Niabella sp.]